jgi:hypothetical protein
VAHIRCGIAMDVDLDIIAGIRTLKDVYGIGTFHVTLHEWDCPHDGINFKGFASQVSPDNTNPHGLCQMYLDDVLRQEQMFWHGKELAKADYDEHGEIITLIIQDKNEETAFKYGC